MQDLAICNMRKRVASDWNELTPEQLGRVVKIMSQPIRRIEAEFRLLLVLLNVKPFSFSAVYWWFIFTFKLYTDEKLVLIQFTDFLFKESTLTQNHVHKFRLSGKIYYGPNNDGSSLRFWEFVRLEHALSCYQASEKAEYIDLLVAILYRPQNPDKADAARRGDLREPLNDFAIKNRQANFAKLKPYIKLQIVLWYQGYRSALFKRYPEIFREAKGDTRKATEQTQWLRIMRDLTPNNLQLEAQGDQLATNVLQELKYQLQLAHEREKASQNHGKRY